MTNLNEINENIEKSNITRNLQARKSRWHNNFRKYTQDISITGFDNDIFSRICQPNLTTVQVDIIEMSKKAVEIMTNLLSGVQKEVLRVSVEGKIIIRDSCSRSDNE